VFKDLVAQNVLCLVMELNTFQHTNRTKINSAKYLHSSQKCSLHRAKNNCEPHLLEGGQREFKLEKKPAWSWLRAFCLHADSRKKKGTCFSL